MDLSGRSLAAVPTTVSRLTKLKCSCAEICALLRFLHRLVVSTDVSGQYIISICKGKEDGNDDVSRNVGNKLPDAAFNPRRAQISFNSRWKPEITPVLVVLLNYNVSAAQKIEH